MWPTCLTIGGPTTQPSAKPAKKAPPMNPMTVVEKASN
jgi:hypothetical protein